MNRRRFHGGRAKNAKKTFWRLISYMTKYYKFQIIIVILAIAISSLASILGTYFLSILIDDFIEPNIGNAQFDYKPMAIAVAIMAGIYLVGIIAVYISNRLMVNISQGVIMRIRNEVFAHMQTLPVRFFDVHTHGEIMSRFTNDIDALRQMISQSLPQLLLSTVTIVGVFVSMLILSPLLTIFVIIMIIIMVFLVKNLGKKSAKNFARRQKSLGQMNGFIEEMIEGQKVVKVFSHEEKAKADFDVINDELTDSTTKANTYANILMPIMGNLSYFTYAVTAVVGGIVAIFNISSLSLGQIASFLEFTRKFSRPIAQISQQFNSIIMALAGAERTFEILDQKPDEDFGEITLSNATFNQFGELEESKSHTGIWAWKETLEDGKINLTQVKGNVIFNDVSFGYDSKKIVLRNISLYANPGEKIAFVGATGAGKTTITNLINRFYDIHEGLITYDGIDIKKIKKTELRKSLSMVLQDTHLFSGTVKDNIRYGKLDATDEEIYEAAKLANADYFISHLPQGYDTMLTNDGENLSQGQRQLLAIARAAVADPPVLILDEATSSIDTRTEKLIERGMDKLMEGRTVFVIAHRLSTVRDSEAIMVLDQGEIIERGNHDDLINLKGTYYQLYTGMFELS
ncbi:MAG: ABC transporter ATP-binding protein [Bacilli bacterium]|nr:ABC transporter ATP-binding protein [Bacilli bacterium]